MESQKQKSNKGLIISLIIMGILFLLVSLAFVYFYFFQNNELSIFNIEDVDPSIANKLSGSIVYSSDREEDASYFSPNLELTFIYNEEIFSISESSNSVSINPRNYEEYTSAYLKTSQSTDIRGLLLETSYYQELEVVSEDTEEDVKMILFSYAQPSLVDKEKTTNKNLSVFYRTFNENQTVYIEIKDFNYMENEDLSKALENILLTLSFDISEVEQELQAQINDGTLNISFDRTLWSISYQSEQSLSMVGVENNKSTFSANLLPIYSLETVETKDALRNQISNYFQNKGEYFNEKEYLYEQVGEYETVIIGDIEFEKGVYKYNYGLEPNTVETYYITYLPGKELQVTMTIRYPEDENKNEEYVNTLLDSIEIKDEEIYGALENSVLGTSSVSINPATILGQASTVRILSSECDDFTFSSSLGDLNLAGKTYTLCSGGLGSGFVIDDNGNIITNAHVADPSDLDVLYSGASYNDSFYNDLMNDVDTLLSEQGYSTTYLSSEQIQNFVLSTIYELYEQNYLTVSINSRFLYVQGDEPFTFNEYTGELINSTKHYVATLIDSNQIVSELEASYSGQQRQTDIADLALIQVDQTINLPTLPITSTGIVTGQEIFVVGYPALVDNPHIVDTTKLFSSTVTQGTISSIKPNSNSSFDLIHVDASISGGNSGGPIISNDGNVIGVATYGINSGSGNYNIGVSSKAIDLFLAESTVTPSTNDERRILEESLLDISNSYYSKAKEKLQALVDNQSSLGVVINPFIELCDSKITAGEDKKVLFDFTQWETIIIPLMLLILVVMIIILILLINKNKKSSHLNSHIEPQTNS
jgi:S1-C subfamily serine protease